MGGALAASAAAALLQAACGAVDVNPPSLTVRGSDLVTFRVGDLWADPGADCIDSDVGLAGTIRTPLPVRASGAPAEGELRTARSYTVTYECTDLAGNHAWPAQRTVQVVAAAKYWRIKPVGSVGTSAATWFVKGVRFFSDAYCQKGMEVVPRRAGRRHPNGFAFSTPLGSGSGGRAEGAFAAWTKLGNAPTDLGPGWSANRVCDGAQPSKECFVGFAFNEPVVVNCMKLEQGSAPGTFASGLRLQWRRDAVDTGLPGDGYQDFVVEGSGLSGGAATLQRPCPTDCGSCSAKGPATHSCASYAPETWATGLAPPK